MNNSDRYYVVTFSRRTGFMSRGQAVVQLKVAQSYTKNNTFDSHSYPVHESEIGSIDAIIAKQKSWTAPDEMD